jgi:hypothetical protein
MAAMAHLAHKFGGWTLQNYLEDWQKNPIYEAFQDLSREDNFLTIIFGILFQNKEFFKFLTRRSYLAIKSGIRFVLSGNLEFFGEVNCLTIFQGCYREKRCFQIYEPCLF